MIFNKSFLMALCASPLLSHALPAAVVSELERANVNVTEFESALMRRGSDSCPDATGKTSQFADEDSDGNGHYAGSCGGNGSSGKGQCWSDVYAVEAQVQWAPWSTVGANLDCSSSSECEISHLDQIERCDSWSTSTGFSAGIASDIVNVGAEVTEEHGSSKCTTSADTYDCHWDDKGCHKVVASYEYVRVWGYIRRTCKHPVDGEGSQKKRPDGDYTRGWEDWDAKFPTGKWEYSCKFDCDTDAGKHSPKAGDKKTIK